jgi:hypothetical protein
MLTPPKHLIPILVYPGVHIYLRSITVIYAISSNVMPLRSQRPSMEYAHTRFISFTHCFCLCFGSARVSVSLMKSTYRTILYLYHPQEVINVVKCQFSQNGVHSRHCHCFLCVQKNKVREVERD